MLQEQRRLKKEQYPGWVILKEGDFSLRLPIQLFEECRPSGPFGFLRSRGSWSLVLIQTISTLQWNSITFNSASSGAIGTTKHQHGSNI